MEIKIFVVDPVLARGGFLARSLEHRGLSAKVVPNALKLLEQTEQKSAMVSDLLGDELALIRDEGDHVSDTLAKFRGEGRDLPLVAYTTSALDSKRVFDAYCSGVCDYLALPGDMPLLLPRICKAIQIARFSCKDFDKSLLAWKKICRLSSREMEVLQLFSEGNTSKEAARILGISYRTVEVHGQSIMSKLEARNVCHSVALLTFAKHYCKNRTFISE